MALVALWFSLSVNRVFDVPKALALKVGGGSLLAIWLVRGLYGRGVAYKSIKIFIAPVSLFALAVLISTVLSIDPATSIYGVYERQFGLQGFLGCLGLFAVTATCLRSRSAAIGALAVLIFLGGTISAYAYLQSQGFDPFGFFKAPHSKVYSTLGNATFAGNALALIFPVSAVIAGAKSARAFGFGDNDKKFAASDLLFWMVGGVIVVALQIVPSRLIVPLSAPGAEGPQGFFVLGIIASGGFLMAVAAMSSGGPLQLRSASASMRRACDGMTSGALSFLSLMMLVGLLTTRTRGRLGRNCGRHRWRAIVAARAHLLPAGPAHQGPYRELGNLRHVGGRCSDLHRFKQPPVGAHYSIHPGSVRS